MGLRTKSKIALARAAQRVVMGGRRAIGRGPIAHMRGRQGNDRRSGRNPRPRGFLELDLKFVHLLKLDVDGYEVEVVRGARDTLRRFAPLIFFEHAPYVVAEKGYDPDEIAEMSLVADTQFTELKRRSLTAGA